MGSESPTRGYKPRLTEEEKKRNHIDSEKKRREAIRDGFDKLAEVVPGMSGKGRSEALVLSETVKFIKEQKEQRKQLIMQAREKGIDTANWEIGDLPDDETDYDGVGHDGGPLDMDNMYTNMRDRYGSTQGYSNGNGHAQSSSSPDS